LNTLEEQHQSITDDEPEPTRISIAEVAATLLQRWRLLAVMTGLGFALALGFALSIPNQYTSSAQLMPPDPQSLTSTSMLSALTGLSYIAPNVGGLMLNTRTAGGTTIGILSSRTALDDIVNRFDLRQVYHCDLYVDARARLTGATAFTEDKKSGLITISVTDVDRNRARDLAAAYVEELDKLLNLVSASAARRERIFLEQRLKSIKDELDSSSQKLSEFSSRNATLDIQKQGEATVEEASRIEGQLITAQSELSGMKANLTDDNPRVRAIRARINELQSQLRKLSGEGESADGSDLKTDEMLPSVRKLPLLGVTYYDLYRKVAVEESIYETLTKQYELAKVQEAKEVPPIKVLDEPVPAERKSYPHRLTMVILGTWIGAIAGIAWIIAGKFWKSTDDSHPVKALGIAFVRMIRHRGAAIQN
jgi:capsule polysaccharide export protein KpsE/RkpR